MVQDSGVIDHVCCLGTRIVHFVLNAAPYIGLVLLGHTVTSLDHHAGDWHWSTYLISCASTVLLGIVIYCAVAAMKVPQMWGYALAVLAGRNTKESLDVFSRDLMEWFNRLLRRK